MIDRRASDGLPQPRVLIVDDAEPVLRIHARALTRSGYTVETANSGHSALQALKNGTFDVIISDIDMPEMDGMRLLEQVRVHDVDVPVILITGAPSMETAVQALDLGAFKYLSKPTTLEALVKVTGDAVAAPSRGCRKARGAVVDGRRPFFRRSCRPDGLFRARRGLDADGISADRLVDQQDRGRA